MRTPFTAMLTIILALAIFAQPAWARHPPITTAALVNVDRTGVIVVTVYHDALAFALNDTSAAIGDREMYALLDGPEADLEAAFTDGRERFMSGFHLAADGKDVPVRLTKSPDAGAARQWKSEHSGKTLPCKLDFVAEASLPAGTSAITLRFPEILADVVMVVHRPANEPISLPLRPGEVSPEIDVPLGGAAGASSQAGSESAPAERATHEIGVLAIAWRFVRLGFNHIIPNGADHCLFVLGLFLLSPRIKPVLWQISSFTVAHTITLTLTSLHIIGLTSSVVEPTIAASIAFIGVENLITKKVHSWRVVVAFIFGLVHGMGVATAFNEAGFPPGQLVTSLAAFTVGVEGGHLAVLLAAFLALGWSRNKKWYRQRVAIPLSLTIAAIALFWMVQRIALAFAA